MENCGAGSVSDIIRLRNKTVGPFSFQALDGNVGVQQLKEAEYLGHNSQCSVPDTTIGHNLRCSSENEKTDYTEFWLSA